MRSVYNIIEVANVHGGELAHMKSLIKEFGPFRDNCGIKFQPLKYDEIALKDFSWYEVYKELFFSEKEWKEIIDLASQTKDIWIDVFDPYGVRIIADNFDKICGIKFQASVLDNKVVRDGLAALDLSNISIILNISSYSIQQIEKLVEKFSADLAPKEIILQIGFQDYPTELNDCGLSKIDVLQKHFPNSLSFADHLDGASEEALLIPSYANHLGVDIIEKHVMHSYLETKYDFYSSIKVDSYTKYVNLVHSNNVGAGYDQYSKLLDEPFISERELVYLEKTLQIPILNKDLEAGTLINAQEDFTYKRTDQKGLNTNEVDKQIKTFHLLGNDKLKETVLTNDDFRKATIATIVACRLKSSRLPKKALLKIGDLSSVELCIKNIMKFDNTDHVILATSTVAEDDELKAYTFHKDVIFHKGDPDDVIQRYLDIIDQLSIDVIVRITADMPYVSNEILQILLAAHFSDGADYTTANEAAVGTNLEIINTKALKKVKKYFPQAEYSEYMTYYFQNNPAHFRLNFIDLPENLIRDYRLTLDYSQDLEMFNIIEDHFKREKINFSIEKLFAYLDEHPEITAINKDCDLKYLTDQQLIDDLKKHTTIVQ